MKIGTISRILKDDLAKSGAVPAWVDALVAPLNEFISQVGLALKGNLTLKDNFLGKTVTVDIFHAVELEVNPQSNLKVIGMIPLATLKETVDASRFTIKSNGQIGITYRFYGGVPGTKDTVTFFLLFG